MFEITLWAVASAFACLIYCSVFEWTLHKYFMHRPFLGFTYPFKRHALVHHHIFKADKTYHLIRKEDAATIPMAWWNGPVLIATAAIPFLAIGIVLGHWITMTVTAVVVIGLYYWAYERMHWCMHLPKARRLEFFWLFQRLNGHHILHHRYMGKNFNVVLPLADVCFGTFLARSKTHFNQVTGPSVPDVQPKTKMPAPKLAIS